MSEENKNESSEETTSAPDAAQSGPEFTTAPGDPLAGVKKGASDVMDAWKGRPYP